MSEEYLFERLTDQNLPDLQLLIKDLYGREEPMENLVRKYDTSVWGVKYIGYIAYSQNREVAAYYGVFPVMLTFQGGNILAAQSGDTMTHSNHQRKGLFIQLANMTYELAKKEGIQFVFGFPNDNSFPGFQRKLNWKFHERMKNYNFLVPTFPALLMAQKLRVEILKKAAEKCALAIISSFSNKGLQFTDSYIQEDQFVVLKKDEAYFHYKNRENHFIISNGKISAWVKFDGFISIGDLHCGKDCSPSELLADFKKLLRKLKWIAFISGVPRIRMYVSTGCTLDRILSGRYNSRESLHVGLLDFSGNIEIDKLKFTYADYDTF